MNKPWSTGVSTIKVTKADTSNLNASSKLQIAKRKSDTQHTKTGFKLKNKHGSYMNKPQPTGVYTTEEQSLV